MDFFNSDLVEKGGQPVEDNAAAGAGEGAAAGAAGEGAAAGAGEGGGEGAAGAAGEGAGAAGEGQGAGAAAGAGEGAAAGAAGEGAAAGAGEGGSEGAAGAAGGDGKIKIPDAAPEKKTDAVAEAEAALLKRLGLTSMSELENKLKKPLTEEEQTRANEVQKAAVNKYAVEKGYLKNEDIVKMENLRNADKSKLVFDSFAATYKETHKDRKDAVGEANPVTEEEISAAFNSAYHTDSTDPALKKLGEEMLANTAGKIVNELEDKYKTIQEEYQDLTFRKAKSKEYFNLVHNFVDTNMPKELVYGEGDDKVVYQFDAGNFTAKDKKDLREFFVNDADFDAFLEGGGSQKTIDAMKDKMDKFIKLTYHDRIVANIGKIRYEAGLKAGSATGAKAPFVEDKGEHNAVEVKENEITASDRAQIKESFN